MPKRVLIRDTDAKRTPLFWVEEYVAPAPARQPVPAPPRQLRTSKALPQPVRRPAPARPRYENESHRLLACHACGYISCRCPVEGADLTLKINEAIKIKRQSQG